MLDLDDIQGDVPIGLQKDFEDFIFFKVLDKGSFKLALRRDVIGRITSTRRAQQRELAIAQRQRLGQAGVVADFRAPDILRVAPVPLYNSFMDVWRFARALRSHVAE